MLTLKTNPTPTSTTDIEKDVAKAAPKPKPKGRSGGSVVKGKGTSRAKAKARKATPNRGGGKALGDFTNSAKIKVVKRDFPRVECFRSGQTVEQNLAAQKEKGYRGRRKYIRKQVAMKRITLS